MLPPTISPHALLRFRPRNFAVVILVVLLGIYSPLTYAQDSATPEPEPYTADEFDDWLKSIRRFEVIAVGSFPVTYLVGFLAFDVARFIVESVRAGQVNGVYAPIFFAPPNKPSLTNDEQTTLLLISISLSVVVAVVDLILIEGDFYVPN